MRKLGTIAVVMLLACSGEDMKAPENLLDQGPVGTAKIGNQSVVLTPNASGGPGSPQKVLQFTGPNKKAQWVTISIYNPPVRLADGTYGFKGPLVGLMEYGNAGAKSQFEFDIAPAKFEAWPVGVDGTPGGDPLTAGSLFQRSGLTEFSVFGSSFDLSVRNDQNNFTLFRSGVPLTPANAGFSNTSEDPRIFAFVAYGIKPCNKLYRSFALTVPPQPMPAAGVARCHIPALARKVRFFRTPLDTTTLSVSFERGTNVSHGPYTLGPGDIGPLEINVQDQVLSVTVAGAASVINGQVEFELEP